MDEKTLNTDLVKLFNKVGWAYKIRDAAGETAMSTDKRPFDGFAVFPEFTFFYETKLIKNKISAFSKARVEPHQFENLLKLKALKKETAIILGLWIPRKSYRFLVFDHEFLFNLSQKSILKIQLEEYIEKGFAFDIRNFVEFKPQVLLEHRIDFLVEGLKIVGKNKNCK